MQNNFSTPNAQIRKKYLTCQSTGINQTYSQYLKILKEHGVQINSKCFISYFKLKNGLLYSGIATRQQINSHEVIAKVPKQITINSFMATQRQELTQIFKQKFYHEKWAWEYRTLNTYLLYIYSIKQIQNISYHMVLNLSKDINIASFWPQKYLNKFKDLTVKIKAELDKQAFEEQWQGFLQIQQKHQILQNPVFNKQNYRWIFIHLVSRSFGKKLQFPAMVPFCQFINHHSVDGIYDVDQDKNQVNIQSIQSKDKQNKQEQQESVTTEGSHQNLDDIQLDQYFQDKHQLKIINKECQENLNLNKEQNKLIKDLKQSILSSLQNNLCWQDFTIIFVPFIVEKCNLFYTQFIAGLKTQQKTYDDLKNLESSVSLYRQNLISAYKKWKGKKFMYTCPENKQQQSKKILTVYDTYKEIGYDRVPIYVQFPTQEKKIFKNILVKTGRQYKYMPNNQLYFSYGPNSNLTLLLRYGFAIQGNKYEYVTLSFDISSNLMNFSDTISKLKGNSSLKRKFKISLNRLNMDLIMFFRLKSWSSFEGKNSIEELFQIKDYQKQIVMLISLKEYLDSVLQQFEGPYDLTDTKLGYYDYFINVYHQQKQKIIKQHIQFTMRLINFIEQLNRGIEIQKAKDQFNSQQKFIFRHYLSEF